MQETIRLFKRSRTFRMILRSYVPIALVFLLLLSVGWRYVAQTLIKEMQNELQQQFAYVVDDLTTCDEELSNLCSQLQVDTDLLVSYDAASYTEISKLQDKLRLYSLARGDYIAIWYHCEGDRFWYSGTDSNSADRFVKRFALAESAQAWNESLSNIEGMLAVRAYDQYIARDCILFVNQIRYASPRKLHYVAFELDVSAFERRLERLLREGTSLVTLTGARGALVSLQTEDGQTSFGSGALEFSASGNGWTLRMASRTDDHANTLLNVLMIVLCLVVLLVILLQARSHYMPISKIKQKISELICDDSEPDDDYEYIDGCIALFQDNQNRLKSDMDAQREAFLNYVHFMLLRGKYTDAEMFNRDVSALDVPLKGSRFLLLALVPARASGGMRVPQALAVCVFEALSGWASFLYMPTDLYGAVLILSFDPDQRAALDLALSEMSGILAREDAFDCVAGCSAPMDSFADMPVRYAQALAACRDPSGEARLFHAGGEDAALRSYVEACLAEPAEAGLGQTRALLLQASERWKESDPSPADAATPVERMKRYAQEHFDDPNFSIQAMADRFGVSISTLSGNFKRATGASLTAFITKMKIDRAKWLLEETEMSVTAVGMSVGYYNCASFIRRFRLETGTTPAEYRNTKRAAES